MVPGTLGDLLSAILAGGAFAAFLSTASGLTVSVAGVIDQDLLSGATQPAPRRRPAAHPQLPARLRGRHPRPVCRVVAGSQVTLADTVGMAFAVAASTFCPLLVLGVWWRRLSVTGALAGLAVGGALAIGATVATVARVGRQHRPRVARHAAGPAGRLDRMPIAFATAVIVSLATPARSPRTLARSSCACTRPKKSDRIPA
jgi:cation/acetate symporter